MTSTKMYFNQNTSLKHNAISNDSGFKQSIIERIPRNYLVFICHIAGNIVKPVFDLGNKMIFNLVIHNHTIWKPGM